MSLPWTQSEENQPRNNLINGLSPFSVTLVIAKKGKEEQLDCVWFDLKAIFCQGIPLLECFWYSVQKETPMWPG